MISYLSGNRSAFARAILLIAVIFVQQSGKAQNFVPDQSFGTNGYVQTTFDGATSYTLDFLRQSDGNLFVAGWTQNSDWPVSMVRYDFANGAYDPTFRGTGTANLTPGVQPQVYDAAQQPDGKIIIVGSLNFGKNPFAFRINIDGSVDREFGFNGRFILPSAPEESAEFTNVKIMPDGKIICAGYFQFLSDQGGFLSVRLNADGLPDSSYGDAGIATISKKGIPYIETQFCRALFTSDDKIVFASNSPQYGIVLERMNSFGHPDSGFNHDGIYFTQVPCDYAAIQMAVELPNGDYAVGFSREFDGFGIAAFKPNGSPDLAFGNKAVVLVKLNTYFLYDFYHLSLMQDGKLLLAGNTNGNPYSATRLIRFDQSGNIDLSFGDSGWVTLPTYIGFPDAEMVDDTTIIVSGTIDGGGDGFNLAKLIKQNGESRLNESSNVNDHFSVFPNPASAFVTVNFSSLHAQKVQLRICNEEGKSVLEKSLQIDQAGDTQIPLDIATLPEGLFIVEVITDTGRLFQKLIIRKQQ